jgi:hypothetical protein
MSIVATFHRARRTAPLAAVPALALLAALSTPASIAAQEEPRLQEQIDLPLEGPRCAFAVYNRSESALAVRVLERGRFTALGEMNPGELLNGSSPCAQGRVYVQAAGIAQPWYPSPLFRAWGELVEGERTSIWLQFPSRRYEPNVHAPRLPPRRPQLSG